MNAERTPATIQAQRKTPPDACILEREEEEEDEEEDEEEVVEVEEEGVGGVLLFPSIFLPPYDKIQPFSRPVFYGQ